MCRNVKSCSYHINLHKLNPVHMLSGSFPFYHFFLLWGAELMLWSCGYHRKQDVIQERVCWMDSCNIFSKLQAVQLYDTSMCSSSRSGEPWNRKHDYWDYICTHTHTPTNYFSSLQGWGLTSWKKNLSIFHNHYWHCLCFLSRGHYISQQAAHILRGQLCKSC